MSEGQKAQRARFSLEGKIALVTGGHRGIGRDITLGLARAGADVIVLDRHGPGDSGIPTQLRELGRRHWSYRADLEKSEEVEAAITQIKQSVPRVDILVNNAGISRLAPLESLSIEDWDATLSVNLRAPFLLARAFAPGPSGMAGRGGGAIVNVSSVSGTGGIELHGAYCASKAGLEGLTRAMAAEWGLYGVRVNAVAPTVVLTEMGQRVWTGEKGEMARRKIPMGRFVEGVEVGDVVVFLASEAAGMVHGAVLPVDGGYGCV